MPPSLPIIFSQSAMWEASPRRSARAPSGSIAPTWPTAEKMIGSDGGITDGDAHLTNYRENAKFFLDPFNPANFEVVWNSASTIYKSLGTIDTTVPSSKVKASSVLADCPRPTRRCATFPNPLSNPTR